jgi:hypothetical protein
VIKEHYAAVKALMPAGLTVYLGDVPELPAYPYAVLWGDLGEESSGGPDGDSLEDSPDVLSLRPRVTYAGLTFDSVLITARNVRAALNRKTPTVEGWRTNPLRQSSLMDVQVDHDVTIPGSGTHPLFAVDEFALTSVKL